MAIVWCCLPASILSLEITRLIVQPSEVELRGRHSEHGLIVSGVLADGRILDVTSLSQFKSQTPASVVVSTNGLCRALQAGQAIIQVECSGLTERVTVRATNSTNLPPPSFREEVLPLLTRYGCNAGNCHGKQAGQNGFRLSLRAYAPEWDHAWLTTELWSRRIDYAHPEESLLVLKPLAQVPHEGGQRFPEGSRAHQLLLDWIKARTPGPDLADSSPSRLEILPGNRRMTAGQRQQLLVRAHYSDGEIRDVTWLSQFFSNDETTVQVSPEGLVKSLRSGETSVRVHFRGLVDVVRFTIPYDENVDAHLFAKKNNLVDEHLFAKLMALRIPPSPVCDDATFLRRAFLDATGTLPTPEEARDFLADQRADKRSRLISNLLERPEYVDYWTLQLADLLQNRKERDHDVRGSKGVRAFHNWLRSEVAANRPWDQLTRAVLLANGDSVAHPEIGYYITTVGEKQRAEESEIVDSIAQSFLGTRIGCARCHNHPLEKFTQDDFYHFAAFFSRVSLKRENPADGRTILSPSTHEEEQKRKEIAKLESSLREIEMQVSEKTGEELELGNKKIAEQKKRIEDARKQLAKLEATQPAATQPRTKKSLPPRTLDRAAVEIRSGGDPREALAEWMTDPKNEAFSGAMINRIWRHFMGVGLIEPVDDLRASNPPSNAELWRALNAEFVSHRYDLKYLMRLILNSRAYQLSSTTLPANENDRRFYSHYYARRLPAEVLLDALSQATGVPDQFAGYPVGTRAIQLPEPGVSSYFLSLFGRSDRVTACACERAGDVTLPQLLHLNNGEDVLRKIRSDESLLATLLNERDEKQVIATVFLAALARYPSADEIAAVENALSTEDSRKEVYRDLLWALLNTKEFAFNH